jgi:SAM-dependent methyltransferase
MKKFVKKIARYGLFTLAKLESVFDKVYLSEDVPLSTAVEPHELMSYFKPNGKKLRVLEIGSREVTGPSIFRKQFENVEYVGFDYYAADNVDVVGDVHKLSTYFKEDEQFDIIYTFACFEHFAMPWLVAQEIAKVLKVGGVLYIRTHFSFSAHERPWNFFQFSDMGLRVLFSSALGFKCSEAGMSNPIVGRFSGLAAKRLRYQPVKGLYCGSEYLGTKVRDEPSFDWNHVSVDEVVAGTTYPAPQSSWGLS